MYKTYQFKLSIKDASHGACKTANGKKCQAEKAYQVGFNVLQQLHTDERLVRESNRAYMLAFPMYVMACRSLLPMS
jgi:hypothetical protein